MLTITILITASILLTCVGVFFILQIKDRLNLNQSQQTQIQTLLSNQQKESQLARERFDEHQINSLKTQQESLQKGLELIQKQISDRLKDNTELLNKSMEKLTDKTEKKLKDISGEVDKRLTTGFEKTTATFADVMKRLTIIDEAQKKITELSGNVVSLQEVLSDKKSRGAFGEVQLNALIRNVLPEANFNLQHTLSNGKRVDCMLLLPEPTGNVAVDSKFPLETYRKLQKCKSDSPERTQLESQFKVDLKKHIQDIHDKYIIEGETSDGAVMFIPA